jgi:hypothetical protein
MKILTIILLFILVVSSISFAQDITPTICRSNDDEIFFRKLSSPKVQVLAVCPKKGLYFVEVFAEPKDISDFKEKIFKSDLKVTGISVYKKKTETGSMVLMVEFEY